ncbi:NAD-dependent epimerase/dehydratase family protein [Gammaproteobacteria bacterium]|nr:NAD-dependent epimerase/dehydratase family protein [Gammaproteobacteria bacterium]
MNDNELNVLITGGAGNLGGSLARELVRNNHSVVVVDNFITGEKKKLPSFDNENFTFYEFDANSKENMSQVFNETKFDIVFHYAALVGVIRTLENPLMVLDDIEGTRNILELSVENNVSRFFFSSSSEVYGEPVEIPQNEIRTPLNARLPYAIVKNVCEAYCRSYKQVFDLDYTIMRFFNTYGPLQSNDFVITKFIHQALKSEDLTVNGDGQQTRTFLYVDDNVHFIKKLLDTSECTNDTVNIGSSEQIKIIDLAHLIIEITGSSSKIVHLPPLQEGDMTRRQPCISKMESINNKKLISLREGIEKYLITL